jgi:hypothetical protein
MLTSLGRVVHVCLLGYVYINMWAEYAYKFGSSVKDISLSLCIMCVTMSVRTWVCMYLQSCIHAYVSSLAHSTVATRQGSFSFSVYYLCKISSAHGYVCTCKLVYMHTFQVWLIVSEQSVHRPFSFFVYYLCRDTSAYGYVCTCNLVYMYMFQSNNQRRIFLFLCVLSV